MEFIQIKTIEDFNSLQKGDLVVCEFHRDVHDYPKKPYRKNTFNIVEIKHNTHEIILQKKNNIYFNYIMYINNESNLKEIYLIK